MDENFRSAKAETDDFRIYQLLGEEKNLLWIRDKKSTWQSEFRDGLPARLVEHAVVNLKQLGLTEAGDKIKIYDPWNDVWQDLDVDSYFLELPAFQRSLIVRISSK